MLVNIWLGIYCSKSTQHIQTNFIIALLISNTHRQNLQLSSSQLSNFPARLSLSDFLYWSQKHLCQWIYSLDLQQILESWSPGTHASHKAWTGLLQTSAHRCEFFVWVIYYSKGNLGHILHWFAFGQKIVPQSLSISSGRIRPTDSLQLHTGHDVLKFQTPMNLFHSMEN